MDILQREFMGNPLLNWLIAVLAFLVTLVVLLFLRGSALRRVRQSAGATQNQVDDVFVDVLGHTRLYAMLALGVYLGSLVLVLPENAITFLRTTVIILLLVQVAVWGNSLVTLVVAREVRRRVDAGDQSSTTVSLLGFFARVALWSVIVLVVLDNLPNVHVDSLIASLGITGIAVAFALQRILSDIFSSISIALDKPFVIGDAITLGDEEGTVEHIGLKSTRLRSLSGEQIIISNSDMLNSRIKNYKRMTERRVKFNLKIDAATPVEQLTRIPALLEEVIAAQENVRFDRAHFNVIGNFYYDFEVVYWVLSPEFRLYKDTQQAINLAVLNRLQQDGIQVAMR